MILLGVLRVSTGLASGNCDREYFLDGECGDFDSQSLQCHHLLVYVYRGLQAVTVANLRIHGRFEQHAC